MYTTNRGSLDNLWAKDRQVQGTAMFAILEVTEEPEDWACEVGDELVENLTHHDNHIRVISAQVLCNLARSDPRRSWEISPPCLRSRRTNDS